MGPSLPWFRKELCGPCGRIIYVIMLCLLGTAGAESVWCDRDRVMTPRRGSGQVMQWGMTASEGRHVMASGEVRGLEDMVHARRDLVFWTYTCQHMDVQVMEGWSRIFGNQAMVSMQGTQRTYDSHRCEQSLQMWRVGGHDVW